MKEEGFRLQTQVVRFNNQSFSSENKMLLPLLKFSSFTKSTILSEIKSDKLLFLFRCACGFPLPIEVKRT
jgi:hypothetical protein